MEKNEIMVVGRGGISPKVRVERNGENIEDVSSITYLDEDETGRWSEIFRCDAEVLCQECELGVKRGMNERVVTSTVTYGVETWGFRKKQKQKPEVMEIKRLQSTCRVIRMDIARSGKAGHRFVA